MWTKISIAAVVVLLASGFFAYNNNAALEADKLALKQAQKDLEQTLSYLADEQQKLADAQTKTATYKADCTTLDEKLQELASTNEQLTDDNNKKQQELDSMTAELAKVKEQVKGFENVQEVAAEIERVTEENKQLEQNIAEASAKHSALVAQDTQLAGHIDDLNKLEAEQRAHISPESLKTTVSNVLDEWGFVIVNAGADKGVVPGSRLAVFHGTDKIAELSVTNVESGKSAANVIPATLVAGEQIYPGDSVVAVRPE
jgi:septal ring factor EnvC (AmiA/AmiB activator)